jgi:hypothetical protein
VAAEWLSTPHIRKRIAASESADLVILADNATQELIQQGKLAAARGWNGLICINDRLLIADQCVGQRSWT